MDNRPYVQRGRENKNVKTNYGQKASGNTGVVKSKESIVCFNCQQKGHYRMECPQNKNQRENYKQFKGNKTVSANKTTNQIDSDEPSNNLFITMCKINGKKVKCLLDTGSTTTLLKESLVKNLALSYVPQSGFLRNFNGDLVSSIGTLVAQVQVEEAEASVDITIIPDNSITHDCIIGCDFLNKPDIMIVKLGNKMVVHQLADLKLSSGLENNPPIACATDGKLNITIGDVNNAIKQKMLQLT